VDIACVDVTVPQIWGFEDIKGERRHTRRIRFAGPKGEDITVRLVYDYGMSLPFWTSRGLTGTGWARWTSLRSDRIRQTLSAIRPTSTDVGTHSKIVMFLNVLHPFRLELARSERGSGTEHATQAWLIPNPKLITSRCRTAPFGALPRISHAMDNVKGSLSRTHLPGSPRQASDSPGLDSWIKSPSYKKDVMPCLRRFHFSLPPPRPTSLQNASPSSLRTLL
jgi:hypothetical protein